MTIGERACYAVSEKAKQEGITFAAECKNLGISIKTPYYWKRTKNGFNCGILADMYYLGYDILWILTGEREINGLQQGN